MTPTQRSQLRAVLADAFVAGRSALGHNYADHEAAAWADADLALDALEIERVGTYDAGLGYVPIAFAVAAVHPICDLFRIGAVA